MKGQDLPMNAVRAHIKNGAVVLDEPLDLPDGTPVTVNVSNDVDAFAGMDPEERAELEAAIEEGYADFEKGDVLDGIEFAKSLLART
jgi:hypothetical protein